MNVPNNLPVWSDVSVLNRSDEEAEAAHDTQNEAQALQRRSVMSLLRRNRLFGRAPIALLQDAQE